MELVQIVHATGLVDFPIKWTHIKRGLISDRNRRGFCPEIADLQLHGVPVAGQDNNKSVLIAAPSAEDLPEIRQFLEENAERRYTLFGRFRFTQYKYSSVKTCDGVRFYFADEDIAVFFKMRFG